MIRPGACPTGCGRGVRLAHLMCGPCWRQVPGELQQLVYRTWRAYQAAPNRETRQAYIEARDAAIASVP